MIVCCRVVDDCQLLAWRCVGQKDFKMEVQVTSWESVRTKLGCQGRMRQNPQMKSQKAGWSLLSIKYGYCMAYWRRFLDACRAARMLPRKETDVSSGAQSGRSLRQGKASVLSIRSIKMTSQISSHDLYYRLAYNNTIGLGHQRFGSLAAHHRGELQQHRLTK